MAQQHQPSPQYQCLQDCYSIPSVVRSSQHTAEHSRRILFATSYHCTRNNNNQILTTASTTSISPLGQGQPTTANFSYNTPSYKHQLTLYFKEDLVRLERRVLRGVIGRATAKDHLDQTRGTRRLLELVERHFGDFYYGSDTKFLRAAVLDFMFHDSGMLLPTLNFCRQQYIRYAIGDPETIAGRLGQDE
ncbi:hypothetical protein EC957_009002 [Mortierella hygrophila]|uniref:Uncharacterized protein n=1 Tax=Mortierella hygrophila TaxID=979708 RepID=A0A9P6FAQ4_9FUNG|nr:hypothetical protein EC957_009002 [Mortierella hygrophila]